jgi:hypothetical protein
VGDVARIGERRDVYRVLGGILWKRDYLVDPGVDGVDIKMDLQEVGCWI